MYLFKCLRSSKIYYQALKILPRELGSAFNMQPAVVVKCSRWRSLLLPFQSAWQHSLEFRLPPPWGQREKLSIPSEKQQQTCSSERKWCLSRVASRVGEEQRRRAGSREEALEKRRRRRESCQAWVWTCRGSLYVESLPGRRQSGSSLPLSSTHWPSSILLECRHLVKRLLDCSLLI